ncbi:MAG: type II toxin-antitoxin system VapC family toxin [Dethiobacter sp.]|nr:type II toxin-antitoxin system VapC family toxin [Dethiobacter sp.]
MSILLDTQAFLWWISDAPQLSQKARQIIGNGENALFLSAASGWEIAIKTRLGKLNLPADIASFIAEQLSVNAITPLPIQMKHALHLHSLPDFHRDPFDRMIVAQAQVEGWPVLTADPQLAGYSVQIIW